MKQQSNPEAGFYFDLTSNGDHISFQQIEGVSTRVAAPASVKEGENPFKYRLPSLPKTRGLVLKNGHPKGGSKLSQWCASVKDKKTITREDKSMLLLQLKDAKGKSHLEWTLYGAYPVRHLVSSASKSKEVEIEDLEIAYSFYALSKK
jgi:phage tail-like protein